MVAYLIDYGLLYGHIYRDYCLKYKRVVMGENMVILLILGVFMAVFMLLYGYIHGIATLDHWGVLTGGWVPDDVVSMDIVRKFTLDRGWL